MSQTINTQSLPCPVCGKSLLGNAESSIVKGEAKGGNFEVAVTTCRSCWSCRADFMKWDGQLLFTPEQLRQTIEAAHRGGFRVGKRAVNQ